MLDRLRLAASAFGMIMASGGPRDATDDRWWGHDWIGAAASGERVTADSALTIPVYQAGLDVCGRGLACLPLKIFERTDTGRQRADWHPVDRLLRYLTGPERNALEFREMMTAWLRHYRAAYAWIVPDSATGGPVGQLVPIHPGYARWFRDDDRVWLRINAPHWTGPKVLPSEDVFKLRRGPYEPDLLNPIPTFVLARETLAYAQAVHRFGATFFRDGRGSGGTVEFPAGAFDNAEQRNAFVEWFKSRTTGARRHDPIVIPNGGSFKPSALKNNEAQFIEARRENNYDVARALGVIPHKVGLLDKATFSNIEQQELAFIGDCLIPDGAIWEAAIGADLLLNPVRFYAEHDYDAAQRADIKTKFEAFAKALAGKGFMSQDEVRDRQNLDRRGGDADALPAPLNMSSTNGDKGE